MPENKLRLIVETPRMIVLDEMVATVRVPTETGQVGLRYRHEPMVLAVESGLVLARIDGSLRFIGTIGGLLYSDGHTTRLLTPWSIVGKGASEVWSALEQALAAPDAEIEARIKLGRLEASIVNQVRREGEVTLSARHA